MPIRTLIIALAVMAALAGCGRRGDLEPPDASSISAAPATNVSPLDPGSVPPAPAQQIDPPPRRHFILDFLL